MQHSNLAEDQFQNKLALRALKQTQLNVLAVDDEPGIRELLQTALADFENCRVSVAGSASEAIGIIQNSGTPFDCFLLDIQMPGTSGIELLRRIRKMPGHTDTPAIMLSALSDRDHVEAAFSEGAFDYVTKPFDIFELRSRMNAAQLLMQERLKAQRSLKSVKSLREELDHNQQFSFEDPLSFPDLQRCLRYVEFDNYIEKFSRGRLFETWVTAVKLQDAEFRFDLNDFGDFRRSVSDLGNCIEMTSRNAKAVFCYRGGGVFLIVTHGWENTGMLPSEERLSQMYETTLGKRGVSGHLRAVKSSPLSMRSFSKAGAFAAMNKAVDRVNFREQDLRRGAAPQAHHYREYRAGQKPKTRLFDTVLRELYGTKTYLDRS